MKKKREDMTDADVCRAIIALANAVLLESGKDIKFVKEGDKTNDRKVV